MHKNLLKYPPVKAGVAVSVAVAVSITAFAILTSVEMVLHWPIGFAVAVFAGLLAGIYVEFWVFPKIRAKREALIQEAVSQRGGPTE